MVPAYATGYAVCVKISSGIRPFAEINTVETQDGNKYIDNIWFPIEYPKQLSRKITKIIIPKIRMEFHGYELPGDA